MNILIAESPHAKEVAQLLVEAFPLLEIVHHSGEDIKLAHDILDSTNTIFLTDKIGEEATDLIARALLSTEGAVYGRKTSVALHVPDYSFEELEDLKIAPINRGPGTGHWKENGILLVGERPGNPLSLGKRDAAFFSVKRSPKWLRKRLNIPEHQLYWANAFDREGIETDWEFVRELNPRKIFALGGTAYKSLQILSDKFSVECVPHPSYWSRFKNSEPYPLQERIENA